MPEIAGIRIIYAGDGVTLTGIGVTPPSGAEIVVNATSSPGATPSAIETAATNFLNAQLPACAWLVHCYSVMPYRLAIWCGKAGTAPPNAVWWP